jgi:hypothetical protein
LQLLHLLALGHQLHYGLKHSAHTGGVQGGHNHDLALVGCILAPGGYLERGEVKLNRLTSSKNWPSSTPITS